MYIHKILGFFILSFLWTTSQAAIIEYSGTVQAQKDTDIPWVAGSTMWGEIDSANGVALRSEGLTSLQDLNIALFRFDFGDLELTDYLSPTANEAGWQYYTEGDLIAQPITFYYSDTEWASGKVNFLQTNVNNSADIFATGSGSVNLEAYTTDGSDFYNEVMSLTSGTGLMEFSIANFTAVNNAGLFNSSGKIFISPVPTPSTMALMLLGLLILSFFRTKPTPLRFKLKGLVA